MTGRAEVQWCSGAEAAAANRARGTEWTVDLRIDMID